MHAARHQRGELKTSKLQCSVPRCEGRVEFLKSITDWSRYCRLHERKYLEDHPRATEAALDVIGQSILVRGELSCWQFTGHGIGGNTSGDYYRHVGGRRVHNRSQIRWAGQRFLVSRMLYVWFFGGHRGGLELHHYCQNPWCVRPEHLHPVTRKQNMKLKKQPGTMTMQKWLARDFAASNDMLDAFIAQHPNLSSFTTMPHPEKFRGPDRKIVRTPLLGDPEIPTISYDEPEASAPAPKVEKTTNLFLTERPRQEQPPVRRRRISTARSSQLP